jgi:hypothetical protein
MVARRGYRHQSIKLDLITWLTQTVAHKATHTDFPTATFAVKNTASRFSAAGAFRELLLRGRLAILIHLPVDGRIEVLTKIKRTLCIHTVGIYVGERPTAAISAVVVMVIGLAFKPLISLSISNQPL